MSVSSTVPRLTTSFMAFEAPKIQSTMSYTQEVLKCVLNDLIIHVYNLVQYTSGSKSTPTWVSIPMLPFTSYRTITNYLIALSLR